ncbi:hypothetical protein QTI33_08070 [Variovorax sp. J22P271]|uniref:hypothetical protein n=1 Tax=Variovorax davisae TaxID=3053515 RepID=UPI0025763954|nr:hypothetical protein [Variovorax sp. J22P271]MDM0032094.1 hypothetical protein [Variovorax sp. J22P271]
MVTIVSIEKVLSAYVRARELTPDHDKACAAAAQALGIAVESVRDAVALTSQGATA